MKFSEIIDQASLLLRRKGRITYRSLKLEFDLEDEQLDVLKEELIDGQQIACDENAKVLVWAGSSSDEDSGEVTGIGETEPSSAPDELQITAAPNLAERPFPTGERRQLTVMFCDLVGSTALSEQLDPEDLHVMIRAYQAMCGQIIERYDGTIAQYLGDGLLVYFGYPAAHEDDARRAVRAGLDILKQIPQLPSASPLQVRIGLHTGPVVVGEIGQGEKREQLALGETPNIAARVQSQAEPNTLVISASTYRLVQGFFACQELGQHELKGISTSVTLYQVQGEGTAQSSFEVSLQKGLTPLVGREEEVELLQRRWERTVAGEGQVVLISGEAGIGKSRLLQVLKDDIVQDEHWGIEAGCSPFYENTALYPVTDQLQRFLQFRREDTATEKRDKLRNALQAVDLASVESLALVANLLSIPAAEEQEPLNLSAQKQKEKTLEVLITWVQKEAERQPVLLVVEDLHWADPSTLELLRLLIERVSTARVLVVLTFRPEFSPPWPMRGYLSTLTLSRLLHQQVELMACRVAGEKTLPKELIDQLVAKTDGVPLFVEEITKSILESDALQERDDHYELIGPLEDFHIPSTLQDSLMARLDRLKIARDIAQFGAVLGREFSYELLYATAGIDEDRLQHGLTQLIEAELVYVQGFPPEAQYTFKHALVQDAAYQSLLKSTRREQHQRVARVLVERFADTVERQPELVAHHYTEAGLIEQAVPYWQQAGQKAAERSAYTEALRHISIGLDLLVTLPDIPERVQQELMFQVMRGSSLMSTQGWTVPEVEHAYSRAQELCTRVGETPQLYPVLWGLGGFYLVQGKLRAAQEMAEQSLSLAQRLQDPVFLVGAHFLLGNILFWRGEFILSRKYLEQSGALYHPDQHPTHLLLFGGVDAGVYSRGYSTFTLWSLGYPDLAVQKSREAFTLAQEVNHSESLAWVLSISSSLRQLRREEKLVREKADATIALADERGFAMPFILGNLWHGWSLAVQGEYEKGLAQLHEAVEALVAMGAKMAWTWGYTLLADAYAKAGNPETGLKMIAEGMSAVEETDVRAQLSELYCLKAELLLQSSEHNPEEKVSEAEACFQPALEVARQQEAKSLELRAVTGLARLWQRQGKNTEAQALLSPVYNWLCVQRRLAYSVGVSPTRVRIRSPVAWMAGGRETQPLKPIDTAIERMVASPRAAAQANAVVAPQVIAPEAEPPTNGRRPYVAWQPDCRHGTLRRGESGSTGTRLCRATGEARLAPGRNPWSKVGRITVRSGKATEGQRVAAGFVVAWTRGNARRAKRPYCEYRLDQNREAKAK